MSTQYKLIRCTINGKAVERMVDVRASLTDMLRNDFRLTRRPFSAASARRASS